VQTSTKLAVHNIVLSTEENRATKNFVKFVRVVFEIWEWRERRANMKITVLCTP